MSIKPLPGYVLVSPIVDEKSSGGLYVANNSQDKPSKGKIVSTSGIFFYEGNIMPIDGTTLAESYSKLKVGSEVVYKKWTNQEVEYEGKKYLLVKFDELLGIIE